MRKFFLIICASVLGVVAFSQNVNSASATKINLSDLSSITKYDSLDAFLSAKNSSSLPNVYVTNFLYDGVGAVKTPDLDDFVEINSNDAEIKTLKLTVVNIAAVGNYEFSGEITGAMIAVNTNGLSGDINLILNGAKIDTDSKKAPAVFVYNKDKNYTGCKVTIKTVANTSNYFEGGKLKKVSLIDSNKLSDYAKYYSGTALTNYNSYSNYYGIYESSDIDKVLFATVQADNEDLQDGDPYVFYKASGAVSSDIDLYFEGEGYLKITSKNKEGVETKGNLTFSGGTGDYEIYSQDDCLNTTTASSSGTSVRNDLSINVHSLLASVATDADEGDAIDSNGTLTIDGGTIYAFAHPSSPDAGLDSGNGTYINGGTVIATGNMMDQIANGSKQKYLYANFNSQIEADTLVALKDQNNNVIVAFKTDRTITNLIYSSADLNYQSFKAYTGGTIEGKETNGLYTEISNYTGGSEIEVSSNAMGGEMQQEGKTDISQVLLIALLSEIGALIITIIIAVLTRPKSSRAEQ